MTIKSSVFIAISLDGYIAREDGGIEVLSQKLSEKGIRSKNHPLPDVII